jgi:hypothetical protein
MRAGHVDRRLGRGGPPASLSSAVGHKMIVVFQDDGTVRLLETEAQANREYETIDVENGEYTFVDERGFVLKPAFRAPMKRKLFFFFSVTEAGPFTLRPTTEKREDLLVRLRRGEYPIDEGPTPIRTLDDLRSAAPLLFTT